jgi:hypothetical protein
MAFLFNLARRYSVDAASPTISDSKADNWTALEEHGILGADSNNG